MQTFSSLFKKTKTKENMKIKSEHNIKMSNSYVLNESLQEDVNSFIVKSSQYVYSPDMNNSSYQSIIDFDLSSFSQSTRYCDFKSSFISIPLVLLCHNDQGWPANTDNSLVLERHNSDPGGP